MVRLLLPVPSIHLSFARYLHQLNIDKDLLTMKNFNVYDPMKAGRNLMLDGQTLAHIEVCFTLFGCGTKINGINLGTAK